ncbi:hypothetical protein ACFLQU_05335 [Verrucomicrobiota bacterium]
MKMFALALVALTLATSAHAELMAYDQFTDYTDGNLVGQGQGSGWGANKWVDIGDGDTVSVSNSLGLTNSALPGLSAGGGAMTGTASGDLAGVKRNLETALLTGTNYFGFIMQVTNSPYHAAFAIDDGISQCVAYGGIWDAQGTWQLARKDGAGWGRINTGIAVTTDPTFFVIKLELGATDTARLFVNPANAAALAGAGDASYTYGQQFSQSGPALPAFWRQDNGGNTGNFTIDEIRFGTEAEDMFSAIPRSPNGTIIFIR